jgi:hypothetical protein
VEGGLTVDWTKQAEDMVKTWTDVQKTMWERTIKLAETAREDSAAETWERVSQRVVEAWRESVLRALQAQAEWTRIWSERLAESAGMPTEVAESARRFHGVVQTWTDVQARLWEGWFETVQKASPEHLSSAWDQLMSGWRQGAQRILDAQSQWGQLWTSAATPAEKQPAAATRSKTAKATKPASES